MKKMIIIIMIIMNTQFNSKIDYVVQHKCLHQALKVSLIRDDMVTKFTDVDRTNSSLFNNDSHSDRLLDHYLAHKDVLVDGKVGPGCHCELYSDRLRTERLYNTRYVPGSMIARLSRKV